jgi:hypothetical protein
MGVSNRLQRCGGISKLPQMDIESIQNREIESTHLSFSGRSVVMNLAAIERAAPASHQNHWQLGGIVISRQHAGAKQQEGMIQQGASSFLDSRHAIT